VTPAQDDVYFKMSGVATVRWDATIATVVTEWEGWASPDEFSALLEAEVRAMRDHHCSRQLLDGRRQKGLRQTDQEKAAQDWLPRALASGLKKFAVVPPISGLAAANLKDRLGKAPAGVVRYFATVEEARSWLAG
jgi:hypothetical protein